MSVFDGLWIKATSQINFVPCMSAGSKIPSHLGSGLGPKIQSNDISGLYRSNPGHINVSALGYFF
mgnify:CR=1 FL=1